MKHIKQWFRSACAVSTLLLLTMAFPARAQLTFVTNNGSITITGTSVTYSGGIALVIPSVTNGLPVTSIGPGAFENYNETSLVIPDTVTNLGNLACYGGASLTNLLLGNGLQVIGTRAFGNCSLLRNATLPASVTLVGSALFAGCPALTNAVLGHGLAAIPEQMFQGCTSLKNVVIPLGVGFIDQEAFEDTGLTGINIPASVTNIASYAFDNCPSLTNVVVGSGVWTIGGKAFDNYRALTVNFYFQGGPPQLPSGTPVPNAQIYYLPGATGWGTNFGGFPTTLWNPQAQTTGGQSGVRTNRFGFNITGTTNIPILVELSTNLARNLWTPVQTLRLTNGSCYFSDPFLRTNTPTGRFYRIRSP